MKILKKYPHITIYEYDEDAKAFCKFLDKYFRNKYNCSYLVWKDEGSYKPKSGKYIEFDSDDFYVSAQDLIKIWKALYQKK